MTTTYLVNAVRTPEDGPMLFSRKYALLEPYNDLHEYILLEEFWVWWQDAGKTYRIRVPKGFITDIASIPRWVWSFSGLTPDGLYRNAALIHDWLYMWQGKLPGSSFQQQETDGTWLDVGLALFHPPDAEWSRDEIDRLFLRIMKACGVDKNTRTKIYWSVRLFGWWAFNRNDPSKQRYLHAFDGVTN